MTSPNDEQVQLLVSTVRDYAIFMLDVDGCIVTWNVGARELTGYLPEEAIGNHISIFHTPDDLAQGKPQQLLRRAIDEGRVVDEGWRIRKDGTRFWADVIITALRDSEGRLIGFAEITKDLTSRRAAEEKLRASEESIAATLYSIGDGVLAADLGARVTRINPVAERLTGWSEREAIGRPIEEVFNIINELTGAKASNSLLRVLEQGVVVGLANHTALIARDGKTRPIADSGAPIRDAQGKTLGAVLVFRDVTEERLAADRLRQSEEKLRLMISSIEDYAILMLDPDGRVTSWNPGAESINGYTEAEVLGSDFARFFPADDVAAGQPRRALELAAARGRFEDEGWRVRKDGTRFWASTVLCAVRDSDGKPVGFAKVTRDLTETRKAEEERVRLAHAQEAIRLRDEFLSIASHELKTPLTALKLQLEVVRERIVGMDENLALRMDRAERASARLADLIEALLDVSRIATGRMQLNPEPLDLAEVVRDVVERNRDAAMNARCELAITSTSTVTGRWDPLRVEQIVTNLLSNAIKYAPGTRIELSVKEENGWAMLQVRDAGPGLPTGDMARVFERFERGMSTNYGGMGLGLYITRQIAEAHGGTVTASNLVGGGACFSVRLPREPPASKAG